MSTRPFRPFVPEDAQVRELTWRAVLLGLLMTVILGSANVYLGLRAGMTVAATYPAAVIAMAAMRAWKGSLLEENIARTSGSIGEGVASGAVFTIPAFLIAKAWPSFAPKDAYWKSTVLILVGSVLGVLFISLVRRSLVEDPELPFPESVAASEIHKAGQRGAEAAKYLFWNMGLGGLVFLLSRVQLYASDMIFSFRLGRAGGSVKLGNGVIPTGGGTSLAAPTISPAFLGVGYIIGPRLASLLFSGGVLAWGLLVPALIFFFGPQFGDASAVDLSTAVWKNIVRPIAVGGMLVGAASTLFRMRNSLIAGIARTLRTSTASESVARTERYMSSKLVLGLIAVFFVAMVALYIYFSGQVIGGLVAACVMLVLGFFFAAVSGSLCGFIGSSNNPVSGLTLSTLIVAALLMVVLGVVGQGGVAAVLGVAAVVCVSSAVAGELLQDFKVGYILGGTPRNIQIAELIAVVVASLIMYFPLMLLNRVYTFGTRELSAPQAGLMALIAQGIVGGNMAWPLIIVGIFLGVALLLMGVRGPMIVFVGMYLPIETTAAIFIGGIFRAVSDRIADRRGFNASQKARIENTGVLISSGLIAGEALSGLIWAGLKFLPPQQLAHILVFQNPSYIAGLVALAVVAFVMIRQPLRTAGSPDEPAVPGV